MEGNLRKRFSLSSWMAAGVTALGVGGLLGQTAVGYETYDDPTSNIGPGTYGKTDVSGENDLGIDIDTKPGQTGPSDPGMDRGEDLYQFTSSNITIGEAGGTTIFAWKTQFGDRGANDAVTLTLKGGTNVFDHMGIYVGSRATGDDAVGAETTMNIEGGTNVFTHRLMVGTQGSDGAVGGHSTVNISGGTNVFTYDKRFDGQQVVGLTDNKYNHQYKIADLTGPHTKYLGGGHSADDPADPEYGYATIPEYNYYDNYYGVYFSAMSGGSDAEGGNTQGVDLNISGGKNMFYVQTMIGGGYDDTPYCSINSSSDDNDVVWGGTNTINITGGFTKFAARTFMGAEGSTTTLNISGRSSVFFTGEVISEDMDRALAMMNLEVPGSVPKYQNNYRGGDLPYVFIGGRDMEGEEGLKSSTVVNINGFNKNMTSAYFGTSTFFGGADERWLAGDQYELDADGNVIPLFNYAESGETIPGSNALRKDSGVATVNVNGKIRIGYANTTKIVAERNEWNYNYGTILDNSHPDTIDTTATPDADGVIRPVYNVTVWQDRYEQVRLIGAAEGSSFNAGENARIQFDTVIHAEQKPLHDAASAAMASGYLDGVTLNGYSGYFTPDANGGNNAAGTLAYTTTNAAGEEVYTLETAMIAFDRIHITKDADITLGGIGNIMARSQRNLTGEETLAEGDVISGTWAKEFYTNPTFVDTTVGDPSAPYFVNDTAVNLDAHSRLGSDSVFERTVYDKWFYKITLEDVDPNYAATEGIQTNEVRMHVETKDLDTALVGNMGRNGDTFREVLLTGSERAPAVYEAIEQIISTSETAEDAAANFDQLIGAGYGQLAAAQVRRISNFNSLMFDQIIASDVCLKNLRQSSYSNGCGTSCGGNHCGQCDECGNCRNWTAWGHFYADGGDVDMNKFYSGYETNSYGAMFAIDWTNCESCHFGVYFNYAETDVESSAPMGFTNLNAQDYSIGLYAKWLGLFCTGGYGSLIANVTWTDIESERQLYLDDFFDGNTDGVIPSIAYERGWIFFPCERLSVNPFFGLQYIYYHSEEFTENGYDEVGDPSLLALNVGEIEHHSLRGTLGLRVSRDWMLGRCHDRRFTTRLKAAWMHDFLGECDTTFQTSHVGYPEFPVWNVRSNNGGRDWAILGLGVDFNATKRLSFLVDYNAYVNEYMTIHSGMATVRFNF